MLPHVYFDSYKRYKNGTNQVAAWLAKTAKQHNITFQRSGKKTYILPLAEFSRLATALASKPDLVLPNAVVDYLPDVLSLRKQATRYFRQHGNDDEAFQRDNESHLHVISVLEDVLETLTPFREKRTGNAEHGREDTSDEKISNLFEALKLEDTDDTLPSLDLIPASKIHRTHGQTSRAVVPYVAQSSASDLPFAWFCFFSDLNDIRKYLRETWERYKRGDLGLMATSVTTDMAFQMVKQKEENFVDEINIPQGQAEEYLGKILFDFSVSMKTASEDNRTLRPNASVTSFYNIAEFVYLPNYVHLNTATRPTDKVVLDVDLTSSFVRTPKDKERFDEASRLLEGAAWGMYLLRLDCGNDVAIDTFADAICELMRQVIGQKRGKKPKGRKACDVETLPVWLCFASQVYLDVVDGLGDHMR